MNLIFGVVSSNLAQKEHTFSNKQQLAQAYLNARQFDKAKALFQYLDKIQPLNPNITSSLNKVYLQLKEYDNSIKFLKSKIALSPVNINYYGLLGTTYYTKGDRDSATAIWHKAIQSIPKSEMNFRIISNFMILNRAYDDAIEILKEGKNYAKNPNVFSYELANMFSVLMKYSDAAEEYCEIIQRDPRQIYSVKNRMSAYISRSFALKETLNRVKEFVDNNDSDTVKELLAYLYSVNGDSGKAFKIILALDKKHNEKGNRIFKFSENAFTQNDFKIANTGYSFLLKNYKNSPFHLSAQTGFVRTQLKLLDSKYKNTEYWKTISLPDTNGAFEFKILAEYFLEIEKENNIPIYYKIEALYNAGIIYKEKLLDYDLAEKILGNITRLFPNTNYAILSSNQLGEMNIIQNDLEQAKKYFRDVYEKIKKGDGVKNAALYKLAKINFWQGKFDKALNLLAKVSGSLKDNSANDAIELSLIVTTLKTDSTTGVVFAKGDLLIAQFHFKKAIEIFKKLAVTNGHIIIKEMAKFKLAELYLATDDYNNAITYLEELSNSENSKLYSDEALFLLGKTYLSGLKNNNKAKATFKKLLAIYPNSVYFSQSRKIINSILTKESNTL